MASLLSNLAIVFKELLLVLDSQIFLLTKRSIKFEAEEAASFRPFLETLCPWG